MFKIVRKIIFGENEKAFIFTGHSIFYNLTEKNFPIEDIIRLIKQTGSASDLLMIITHVTDENGDMVANTYHIGSYDHEKEDLKLASLEEWIRENYWHDKMQRENTKFIIMGKSASGKDTFCKRMEEILNIKRSVPFTTRPIRPGEVDGIDYHFISEKEFMRMKEMGRFLTAITYDTEFGPWHYGKSLDDFKNSDYIILTPEERQQFIDAVGNIFDMKTIYFKADDAVRLERSLHRKDNEKEVRRRMKTDEEDFKDFESIIDTLIPLGKHTVIDTTNMTPNDYDDTVLKIASMWSSKELPFA